ncbi:MAG: family 78 glycoside hydrolase catalytic domain [Promethearchaeota archaeon]
MKWKGRWVWVDTASPIFESGEFKQRKLLGMKNEDKNTWVLFRKKFNLPHNFNPGSSSARLFITVDSRYKLFMNGEYVGRGIYRCNKYNWYYDTYNVQHLLKAGSNVLCVMAQFFGESMAWFELFPHGGISNKYYGKGFMIFEMHVDIDGEETVISSDESVRAHPCRSWEKHLLRPWVGLPYIEIFDSRIFPHEWLSLEFDDAGKDWDHLRELDVTNMWPRFIECDIPRLTEERVPAESLVSAGIIDLFFDSEDIEESIADENEQDIDFFMQLGFSGYKKRLELDWNRVEGTSIELDKDPVGLVFDMGREVSGFPFFKVETSVGGVVMDFGWSEKLDPARDNLFPAYKSTDFKFGARYTCKKGQNDHEFFHWHGFRYLQVNFTPPAGQDTTRPVKIIFRKIGINLYLYPVTHDVQFRCSNPRLERLFETCTWTMRNCMHDGYEDCPSREQRQWLGDAYVEIAINFAVFGDTALARKLINQGTQSLRGDGLIQMVTPGDTEIHGVCIPDYSLYWIMIVHQYYWYTGDTTIIKEHFPTMLRIIDWFLKSWNEEMGLVDELPFWIFIDWSLNDKWGANGVINAQVYHVLMLMDEMAGTIGWGAVMAGYTQYSERIRNNFDRCFWDDARGAYIDAVRMDDGGNIVERSAKVTYHVNAMALLHGLCPGDKIDEVFKNVFDQPFTSTFFNSNKPIWEGVSPRRLNEEEHVVGAEPFFMHHVTAVFNKYGRHDLILRFLERGWLKMIDMGATTIWEHWGNAGSLCHAWSATPAHDLVRYCLGVNISNAGSGRVSLVPNPLGMNHASGIVPTIKGAIRVEWSWNEPAGTFTITYDSPAGVEVEVHPPAVKGKMLALKETTSIDGTNGFKLIFS